MIGEKRILALIPARGGSKGILDKNIIPIGEKPLIAFTIEAAKKSDYIDDVVVTTDSEKIARIARYYGAEIPFLRPEELASDHAKTIDAILHAVKALEEMKRYYDIVILLQPTSPLRTKEDIDAAILLLIEKEWNSLLSVSEVKEHPILIRKIQQDGRATKLIQQASTIRRQDMDKYYRVNGCIYLNYTKDLTAFTSFNDNEGVFIMEQAHSIDIDEPIDLEIVKYYLTDNKQPSLGDSNQVSIIMYHYVRDIEKSRFPRIKGLEYSLFKEQIQFLREHFNIITMEQLIAAVTKGEKLPEKAALLTFDDGYKDHYTYVYPVLKEYNLQGSFFVSAKVVAEKKVLDVNKIHYILAIKEAKELVDILFGKLDIRRSQGMEIETNEALYQRLAIANRWDSEETIFVKRLLQNELPEAIRQELTSELFEEMVGLTEESFNKELYLNNDQIRIMKQGGMFFGIHGYNHYWLGKIGLQEMKEDINKALDYFDGLMDKSCWVMNYPYGSYSKEVIEYIQGIGCCFGLSVEPRRADIGKDNRFTLPRFDTNDFPPKSNRYLEIIE